MNNLTLRTFVEQHYCVEYHPSKISPILELNTSSQKWFQIKPSPYSNYVKQFYYDVSNGRFRSPEQRGQVYDPQMEDTFA